MGLSTGTTLAYLGNDVILLDTDGEKIARLRSGRVPFREPELEELLALLKPRLSFTTAYAEAIPVSDVMFLAVGSPAGRKGAADLSQLMQAARQTTAQLGSGCRAIVVKSTVPPGTARQVDGVVETLRIRGGRSFPSRPPVVSNPEFLREGYALHDSLYPDRIVVGTDKPEDAETIAELYRPLLEQSFPSPEVLPRPEDLTQIPLLLLNRESAELVKYAANVFLATKVSFINEIAALAERVGADIDDIAKGIGLDSRIGGRFLQAGIGWGGPCFGKDLSALLAAARAHHVDLPITTAARDVNDRQRGRVVSLLTDELGTLAGRTVTLFGLAFKPRTDDLRDAPSLDIASRLISKGAKVKAHDPAAIPRARDLHLPFDIVYYEDPMDAAAEADAIVLVTDWPEYRALPWAAVRGVVRNPLILDGRNFLDPVEMGASGFRYVGIGRFPPSARASASSNGRKAELP